MHLSQSQLRVRAPSLGCFVTGTKETLSQETLRDPAVPSGETAPAEDGGPGSGSQLWAWIQAGISEAGERA